MWLPVPTPESVEKFRTLAKEEFGLELDEREAFSRARKLLQIYYLLAHCYKPLEKQEGQESSVEQSSGAPQISVHPGTPPKGRASRHSSR